MMGRSTDISPSLFDTDEQRRTLVPRLLSGEHAYSQLFSEPGAGSDLANLQTSAVIDGEHFVINGQKIWTSSAHYSDMMFLLCRTEPEAPKHRGISYLLVDMKSPGIELRPLRTMTERSEFNEVFFTDLRVPMDQIVLGRGDGWTVANVTLSKEELADMPEFKTLADVKAERQRAFSELEVVARPGVFHSDRFPVLDLVPAGREARGGRAGARRGPSLHGP